MKQDNKYMTDKKRGVSHLIYMFVHINNMNILDWNLDVVQNLH